MESHLLNPDMDTLTLRAGNVAIFPLAYVHHLEGRWLSPLVEIPQTGQKSRLIYDYLCSGLNDQFKQAIHKESMSFVKSLHCLLECILEVDPHLGLNQLSRVYPEYAYMRIWVRLFTA